MLVGCVEAAATIGCHYCCGYDAQLEGEEYPNGEAFAERGVAGCVSAFYAGCF